MRKNSRVWVKFTTIWRWVREALAAVCVGECLACAFSGGFVISACVWVSGALGSLCVVLGDVLLCVAVWFASAACWGGVLFSIACSCLFVGGGLTVGVRFVSGLSILLSCSTDLCVCFCASTILGFLFSFSKKNTCFGHALWLLGS